MTSVLGVWLSFRTGPRRGESVEVTAPRFVIGRADGCELVINDPRISRRHVALVTDDDGRVTLNDLGSGNGTLLNGEKVEAPVPLIGGEQIQIGSAVLITLGDSDRGDGTLLGFVGEGTQLGVTESARHRIVVQRSLRRVTVLAGLAVAVVLGLAAFLLLRGSKTNQVERAVAHTAPSTVLVQSLDGGAIVESGTGWVLDGVSGLIVTNAHVLGQGRTFQIAREGGRAQAAQVVAVAPCDDLAVLRTPVARGLRSLRFGRQSDLRQGETVVAVGFPSGASLQATLTSTTGVVSVVRSTFDTPTADLPEYPDVVQTDAAINPGSSGGPLVDLSGKLVGVTTAAVTLTPDGRIIQGQGYAIGVDRVIEVLRRLRTGKSTSWLGAGFRFAPAGTDTPLSTGPPIEDVKSPLGEGDEITGAAGHALDGTLAGWCQATAGIGTGSTLALRITHAGKPRRLKITLP